MKDEEYTLDDVTSSDIRMLGHAAGLPEKSWYCFGRAGYKLYQLGLIDEENRTTELGLALVKYMSEEKQ